MSGWPLAKCEGCAAEVWPGHAGTWTRIEGWDSPREAGGTNHVVLREVAKPERFLCNACMTLKRSKLSPGQGSLL